ncbi:MAG: DEAD/DEAH box helicase [Gammaproteobacteria bacterium]|nr:DEAD/DEAH box helicase [Gammaproteobacteria bacterium]
MSFSSLGLSAEILRAVSAQGYTTPTPIQQQAIPAILEGNDLMAGAQTGTGKTAAFALPLLHKLQSARERNGRKAPRVLVLTPTRELANQVAESFRTYGSHLPLSTVVVFGGVGINPQLKQLNRNVDILVATPGRLIDHMDRQSVDLSQVEAVVLDEADRMLDMGFIHAIKRIMAKLPAKRQGLLFSATFPDNIDKLARQFLNRPVSIEVAKRNTSSECVDQQAFLVDQGRKRELLTHLIGTNNWRQVLVFTRTKHGADRLVKQLLSDGIEAMAIHGNKSQGARERALGAFKQQSIQALIATDVAARGIDIDRLPHVVNYDLPSAAEDYVHRIGRTGRAGSSGQAVSLVGSDESDKWRAIERLIRKTVPAAIVSGFEPSACRSDKTDADNVTGIRKRSGKPADARSPRSNRPRGKAPARKGQSRRRAAG